jgi:hypothetical protein
LEDAKALTDAATADGHRVYYPSFVFEKNKEIVGYCSIAVPMVLSWQDSKKMTAMDSIKELGFIEGALAQTPFIAIPCDPESPYMKFLPKQGYENYFKPVNLFIKRR